MDKPKNRGWLNTWPKNKNPNRYQAKYNYEEGTWGVKDNVAETFEPYRTRSIALRYAKQKNDALKVGEQHVDESNLGTGTSDVGGAGE